MGAQLVPARNAVLLAGWLPPPFFLGKTSYDSLHLGCTKEGRGLLYLFLYHGWQIVVEN